MRPLNRPMFKNGGPIKEGIMQGMKDGGSLSPQFNTGLVGDERYPKTGGREHHFAFLAPIAGGLMTAARALPAVYRGFKAARTFAPGNIGAKARFKDIFLGSGRFRQGQVPVQGNMLTDAQIKAGMIPKIGKRGIIESLKDPKSLGAAIKEYPVTSLSALTLPNLAYNLTPPIVKGGIGAGKMFIDAVLPGEQFKGDDKIEETKETDLKRVDKITNVGEVNTDTTKPGASKNLSDAEKTKLEEDRIASTKEKYYKLMGVDKLNKDATYNTLIDASTKIREGGNIKDQIKSGSLVSNVINSLSKNLDKSVDLKKQIDAAILKGEIEKDINLTKPSAFQEQLAYIRANPNDPLAKKLAGVTSAADIVAASVASGKGTTITSDNIANIIESKGTVADGVIPDDKFQKWEKANAGKDEIDFFIEKYSGLDDGIYVVNKKVFQKQGNQIAPISLDSIVG